MHRPLLDHLRLKGAEYRWAYPISLIIKKDEDTFNLTEPDQLPELFELLGSETVQVPNWTD